MLAHTITSVYDNIFTVFAQRHRPLSFQLQQEANPLASAAATARRLEDLAAFEGAALTDTIADIRRAVPMLGTLLPPLHVAGRHRSVGQSVRVPTTRVRYRIQVLGDETMLTFWPDEDDADLTAVNQGLIDEIGPEEEASDEDAQRYYNSIDWWTLGTARDSPGEPVVALTTYVDLTQEELGQPDKQREVRDLFAQRHAEAEEIVAAIGRQMTKFYEVDLPEALRVRAGWSRARLNDIAAINRTIGLPEGWAMEPPRAVEVVDPVVVEVAMPQPVSIPLRWHLEPTSYENIQRIVRTWANAVEDHPQAYWQLVEDRVSDLLRATLHTATPGASREYFTRGGKADIRIDADRLNEGSGPTAVFVLEAKWVEGREDVESAIVDQLMRYVPVAATSTIFLALSRNVDSAGAFESIRSWAREVDGYVDERAGAVNGWPILQFQISDLEGLRMDVCLATVALPRIPRTRAARASSENLSSS